jgi:peptidoglycan hydrolase-like protein with peptidoglycan-binding domain
MADEVIPTPEVVPPPAPVAAPATVAETPKDPLKHLEGVFNRPFTEADLGSILTWAEGMGNPAIDKILSEVDAADNAESLAALESLVNFHALAATKQPPVRSLSSRLKKASLDSTAREPPAGPAPTVEEVTASLIATARATGREPTPQEVLAAHNIKL